MGDLVFKIESLKNRIADVRCNVLTAVRVKLTISWSLVICLCFWYICVCLIESGMSKMWVCINQNAWHHFIDEDNLQLTNVCIHIVFSKRNWYMCWSFFDDEIQSTLLWLAALSSGLSTLHFRDQLFLPDHRNSVCLQNTGVFEPLVAVVNPRFCWNCYCLSLLQVAQCDAVGNKWTWQDLKLHRIV